VAFCVGTVAAKILSHRNVQLRLQPWESCDLMVPAPCGSHHTRGVLGQTMYVSRRLFHWWKVVEAACSTPSTHRHPIQRALPPNDHSVKIDQIRNGAAQVPPTWPKHENFNSRNMLTYGFQRREPRFRNDAHGGDRRLRGRSRIVSTEMSLQDA
jgi:hypothetical protein